jgi:hypothetical protein
MAFVVRYDGGASARRALPTSLRLNVSYSSATDGAVLGDQVNVWRDRSGNGFHLMALAAGAKPTLSSISTLPTSPVTATPNGKPMLSFAAGSSAMKFDINDGRQSHAFTSIGVIKLKDGTSYSNVTNGGQILTYMGTGTGNKAYGSFWRHPAAGYHSWDVAAHIDMSSLCSMVQIPPGASNNPTDAKCFKAYNGTAATSESSWIIASMRYASEQRDEFMRINGQMDQLNAQSDIAVLNAPYTIALGYNPVNNQKNAEFEVAELVLFDHELSCPQVENVEQYLAQKWGLDDSAHLTVDGSHRDLYQSSGCQDNNIPTF